MRVIGLTGSFASGKSSVAAVFSELGAVVLNADKIAHRLLAPEGSCYRQVIRTFGKNILTAGRIDRKKLGAIVFQNLRQLRKLEKIVHPAVRKVILSKIEQAKRRRRNSVIVIDAPLLFESKLKRDIDVSIVVKATVAKQLARAKKQYGMARVDAMRRINAQMPLRKKIRLADMIIDNNGSLTNIKKQVKQIWEKL